MCVYFVIDNRLLRISRIVMACNMVWIAGRDVKCKLGVFTSNDKQFHCAVVKITMHLQSVRIVT